MPYTLTLRRDLFVPREVVFEVWTEPQHLVGWYAPMADSERSAEVDLRPGGRFHYRWTGPDGAIFVETGEYLAVSPPEGFTCTLCYEGAFADHFCTNLRVTLTDVGGGTRIDIVQSGYPSAKSRDAHKASWPALLDQLEAYFSQI